MFNCVYSIIAWPFYTVNYIPIESNIYKLLWICESIYFIDIILSFFLQELNEDKSSQHKPLIQVATNYFYGNFIWDFIALIPLGELSRYNKSLGVLNVIKVLRIRTLNMYLSNAVLITLVQSVITRMQKRNLMD